MILGARNVGGFKTKRQNSDISYFKNNKNDTYWTNYSWFLTISICTVNH